MSFLGNFASNLKQGATTQAKITTINDLKASLSGGVKNNKFLVEMAYQGVDSSKINLLCKNVQMPERTITTGNVWHQGRKYQVRGETDYVGTLDITFWDDDKMSLRKSFDTWITAVDNSKPPSSGMFKKDGNVAGFLSNVKSATDLLSKAKNLYDNPAKVLGDFAKGLFDDGSGTAVAKYQTEFTIWQLSSTGKKVYGYTVQNAFPKTIGNVQYAQESMNEIVSFTVTFAFSEFAAVEGSMLEQIGMSVIGDDAASSINTVKSIFR